MKERRFSASIYASASLVLACLLARFPRSEIDRNKLEKLTYLLCLVRLGVLIHVILGKDYRNDFVWVMRLNRDGQIDQIRAYYDSAHTDVALAPEMKKAQLK